MVLALLGKVGALVATALAGVSSPTLNWAKHSPATSPPARVGASVAYDPGTCQLVLFGGLYPQRHLDLGLPIGRDYRLVPAEPGHQSPHPLQASMAYDGL